MKANGKLLLLDMAKATKYMYKSWAIGSLIQHYNRIVPNENVAVEPLMPSQIFFFFIIIFLAVASALALTVTESWRAEIPQFLCMGLTEKRGEGRQDSELWPDLLSQKLVFVTSCNCSKPGRLSVLGDRKLS